MTSFYFSISHIIDSKVANNSIKSKFIFSDVGYSHTQVLKKSVYTKDIQKFQQNMKILDLWSIVDILGQTFMPDV